MTAQERFNLTYITSSEIQRVLKVDRSAILYARRTGKLPDPVEIPGRGTFLWERDAVSPYIKAWCLLLNVRRGRK